MAHAQDGEAAVGPTIGGVVDELVFYAEATRGGQRDGLKGGAKGTPWRRLLAVEEMAHLGSCTRI